MNLLRIATVLLLTALFLFGLYTAYKGRVKDMSLSSRVFFYKTISKNSWLFATLFTFVTILQLYNLLKTENNYISFLNTGIFCGLALLLWVDIMLQKYVRPNALIIESGNLFLFHSWKIKILPISSVYAIKRRPVFGQIVISGQEQFYLPEDALSVEDRHSLVEEITKNSRVPYLEIDPSLLNARC